MTTVVVRIDDPSTFGGESEVVLDKAMVASLSSSAMQGRSRSRSRAVTSIHLKGSGSKDGDGENGAKKAMSPRERGLPSLNSSQQLYMTGRVRVGRSFSEPPAPNADLILLTEIWQNVENNWDEFVADKTELSRILFRKGMLATRRGIIWRKISLLIPQTELLRCEKEDEDEVTHSCMYHQLVEIKDFPCEQQIKIDIGRTYSDEAQVQAPEFQQSLLHVLKAFSHFDHAVGYCQGLSFVAALLLINVREEQAFYLLARLLKGHNLRSFYTEDMYGVKMRMYQMNKLTQTIFPNMYNHLEKLGVSIALVTTPWFMTAFGYQLPFEIAFRVMDVLFLEGVIAYFRIALAILVLCEDEIMELQVETVMDYFRSDLRSRFQKNPQQLMTIAHGVSVSVSQLAQMEQEYLQSEEFERESRETRKPVEQDKNVKAIIECHEMKETVYAKEREMAKIAKEMEAYKTKMENEKIALIERLGISLDKVNILEQDIIQLKEKNKLTEKEAKQAKLNSEELVKCNFALAQELYALRKKYKLVNY